MPELYLRWQLDPVLLGGLVALATVFGILAGPLRSRLAPGRPFPTGRAVTFTSGLVLLYLLEGSPLHDLAEGYSLTAHMVQHLGISYLVAPLLVVGTPAWMWRTLLSSRAVRPLARVLLHPLVAFGTFSIVFSVWHVPAIYEGALRNPTLHHAEHLIFLLVSLQLWWPLMSPLPEMPRPPYLVQLAYLFLLPVAQLPVFGAVTFADRVLYDTYATAPWTLGMPALDEQALAGATMKIAGLFAFGVPFIAIFFRWFALDGQSRTSRRVTPPRPEPRT